MCGFPSREFRLLLQVRQCVLGYVLRSGDGTYFLSPGCSFIEAATPAGVQLHHYSTCGTTSVRALLFADVPGWGEFWAFCTRVHRDNLVENL